MSESDQKPAILQRALHATSRYASRVTRPLVNQTLRLRAPTGRPIFVTGNGRSGTSWIGETLGRAPGVVYYHEPCNLSLTPEDDDTVWARYVVPGGQDPLFETILERSFRGLVDKYDPAPLRAAARRWRAQFRVLIKDVATFPSVEWVAQRWNPEILLVVRHPCGCALSVENADLSRTERARLAHLLADDRAKERHLDPHGALLESARTPLEVSAAIWSIKSLIVAKAHARHPEWGLVHYEELCDNPLAGFRSLCARLGLAWSAALEEWVKRSTSEVSAGAFSTRRVSSVQRDAWKRALTQQQVDEVRRIVAPFDLPYYRAEADWQIP